jgi:hypothetical protein
LINYESSLVDFFGGSEALGTELRFPLFVSTITADAVEALKKTRAQVPRGTLDWIRDFEAGLEAGLTADQRFDFRIYLIPQTGPKSTADAALTFVRADQFTPEQNAIMEQVQTIIREKKVPVEDLNGMLPRAVVEQISKRLDKPFTMHTHTQAWRYYKVRPQSSAADPFATKSDFCRYNRAFSQYIFTTARVDYLVRHPADDATYQEVLQHKEIKPDIASEHG